MGYSLLHALHISRQDMMNRLLDLDGVSNNLANVNTTGFKATRANFQELLSLQNRNGDMLRSTQIITRQGSIVSSGRSLDWAIEGEGFFQVELPDGATGYTRDGQFFLDSERNLVNASGYRLVWDGEIPENIVDVALLSDGTLQGLTTAGEQVDLGAIELATFANPSGLEARGSNAFFESESSGEAQVGAPGTGTAGKVKANAYEQSNVNMAEEMTGMITLQRAFQMSVRAFQQTDTMINQAIHMRKG